MYEGNFHVQENSTTQQLPYDFESIMHFQHNAFSINPSKSTLIPISPGVSFNQMGTSKNGTTLDFLHVKLLYCGGEFM